LLTGWIPILSERDGVPHDTLAALPTPVLCQRIAAVQYAIARDTARTARVGERKERSKRLAELTNSPDELDRIAADLVRRWDIAEEARKRAVATTPSR
jgi:hypothetical protein